MAVCLETKGGRVRRSERLVERTRDKQFRASNGAFVGNSQRDYETWDKSH